jgi:hypothetical protein
MSQMRVLLSILAVLTVATAAPAGMVSLTATHDPTQPNFFTLNFPPEYGGPRSGLISATDFVLGYDDLAGTAQFESYFQNIDSIELPGGVQTGAITVTVVPGTSSGTFDVNTGQFSTSEDYSITFENDLSMFGLVSPVVLPSGSTGLVDFANLRIGQEWAGDGAIGNPSDPKNPIDFAYVCVVNTTFVPEPATIALFGLVGLLLRRRRR